MSRVSFLNEDIMHINYSNFALKPDLDQFGDFTLSDVSDHSTYKHPDLHYKRDVMYVTPTGQSYSAVSSISHLSAGNVSLTHYDEIEFLMQQATDSDLSYGAEDLFPRSMQYCKLDWKWVKDNDGTYYRTYEIDNRTSYDSPTYHSLSANDDDDYPQYIDWVLDYMADSKHFSFDHFYTHKYGLHSERAMPLQDIDRPFVDPTFIPSKRNTSITQDIVNVATDRYMQSKYENWLRIFAR